jgi:rhamnosyltransferase
MNYNKIQKPDYSNICAIIVTYYPDKDLPQRVKLIANQVKKVVIVDNGSSKDCISMLEKISLEYSVHLILNEQNFGVAKALNYGFNYAIKSETNYYWCLTMDQDTILYPEMVKKLINSYDECPFRNEIGIIGSNYEEYHTGRILYKKKDNERWAEVNHLPTSGCLHSILMYKNVGNFREDLFIDYIDTEYCIRSKKFGYRIIINSDVNMLHPLGNYKFNSLYKFLTGREMITNYPPIRHYYWTRNGIILIRELFWKNINWSINELYYLLIRRVLIVIIFEDSKLYKLKNIFLGIFHAFVPHSPRLDKM